MGNARVTQGPSLVLAETEPGADATQTAVLLLAEISNVAQATQSFALLLAEFLAQQQVTQTAVLVLAAVAPCVTRDAQCWKIVCADGDVLGFTTHDQPITSAGVTYQPCASLRASAIGASVYGGASTGDIQARGIIDDDAISETDLYSGKYDNAQIIVTLVDWQTGAFRPLTRGIVSKTEQGIVEYSLSALTGGARLQQQPLLNVYSPLCNAEFGDSRCTFDKETLRVSGSVTATSVKNVVTAAVRRSFYDVARLDESETYDNGRLTWTSGNNNGVTVEVKSITDGVVTLWNPCASDIEIGDTYTLVPGCDKTQTMCANTYNNLLNHRGFPDVPGTDLLNQTPDR